MAEDRIDENGLPVYAPGDYDFVRVVDASTGASRNALSPEVTAAARALTLALDGLVADAREDIEAIIRDLGYLAPVPYASGLNVNDIKFTVSYDGDVYAPKPELVPFTTGAWNPAQWNVIQGDINLRSDLADPTVGAGLVAFRARGGGAYVRTIGERLQDNGVSVLDFIPPSEHAGIRNGTSSYDCAPGINAAIQEAITSGVGRVHVPGGKYQIFDTITLGQPAGFTFVQLIGDGPCYRGTVKGGTAIIAGFSDRPAINFQGARGSILRGLSVIGPLSAWVVSNDLCGSAPVLDDTEGASWVSTDMAATQDSRYAPCAGITIDAYAGSAPGTAYPGTYGKGASSKCGIEDVIVSGFTVGFVCQPSDYNGNGDFTALRRVQIERCKYAISVGNSQSRNFAISEVDIAQCFIALTNDTHGRQTGNFGGTISNLSIGRVINLLKFTSSAYFGPLRFLHLYAENLWRLGTAVMVSSNENALTFDSCHFSLAFQNVSGRGVPGFFLQGSIATALVKFDSCSFRLHPGVLAFQGSAGTIMFDGCSIEYGGGTASEYQRLGHQATSGGIFAYSGVLANGSRGNSMIWDGENVTAGGAVRKMFMDGVAMSNRDNPVPILATYACPSNSIGDRIPLPNRFLAVAKSALSSISINGRELTFQFSSRSEAAFLLYGPDCGDVVYDSNTGTVFYVRSRTGTTVIAVAQNNYREVEADTYSLLNPVSTTDGSLNYISSRLFMMRLPLFGDVTASSSEITNAANGPGNNTFMDEDLAVGDAVWLDRQREGYVSENNSVVVARDQTAKTITLSGNATRTHSFYRLPFFVRKPPTNV